MPIEFSVGIEELRQALKYLFAIAAPTEHVRSQFVDVNARDHEVELVTTGTRLPFRAQVVQRGYGRAPYAAVDWVRRAIETVKHDPVRCLIEPGRIRVANHSFTGPEVTVRHIGERIADIPSDAALPDVLALFIKYRPEELEDSGLMARVFDAQEQASMLIDKASLDLQPLGISREEISAFVTPHIKQRANSAGRLYSREDHVRALVTQWKRIIEREGLQAARDAFCGAKLSLSGQTSLDRATRRALLLTYRAAEREVFGTIEEVAGAADTLRG